MRYVEHEMIQQARDEHAKRTRESADHESHADHSDRSHESGVGDEHTSIETLKANIAATRERIAENAEALAYKTDVSSRVSDVAGDARERFEDMRDRISGAVGDVASVAVERASDVASDAKVVLESAREHATVIAEERLNDAAAIIDDPAAAIAAVKVKSRRSPIAWTIAFVFVAFAFALLRRRS